MMKRATTKTQVKNSSSSLSKAQQKSRTAAATNDAKPAKPPTWLPHSAPASSLLPSLSSVTPQITQSTGVPNPAQLLSQYALLLQSGAVQGAATLQPNPFGGAVAVSAGQIPPHPAPDSNNTGHATHLLNSIAQMVAAQASSATSASASAATAPSVAAATTTSQSQLPAPTTSTNNYILPSSVHNWSSGQLAKHVSLLRQLKQPVPQSLSMLLSEAQRRHDKKEAKRVANRKSASISRARKKVLVQEMTELNARLKRQALILALLPDLVITIDVEGVITFCSEQVERVLRYNPEALVGSKLTDLLVPSSRAKLLKLINEMVDPDRIQDTTTAAIANNRKKKRSRERMKNASEESAPEAPPEENKSAAAPSSSGTGAAVVSDTTCFPMSVVTVDPTPKQPSDENENSDTSTSRDSKQLSSLTNSASLTRSPIADTSGNSGSDDASKRAKTDSDKKKKGKKTGKELPRSDTSNTSCSVDADVNKLSKANANLERNVRWHNKKMKNKLSDDEEGYKDDVIGAAVTANNASARLSSLRVHDRPEASSEEDSGYRESNDSREETSSSSASDMSESNGRRKPLAPTCNICLIRNDLTTVWCEVTSSVRTRDPDEDVMDSATVDTRKPPPDSSQASGVSDETAIDASMFAKPDREEKESVKELLLCLRPIRDGNEKVDAKLRLVAGKKREVSEGSNTGKSTSAGCDVSGPSSSHPSSSDIRPKKRRTATSPQVSDASYKRMRTEDAAIAESLMLMSSKNA